MRCIRPSPPAAVTWAITSPVGLGSAEFNGRSRRLSFTSFIAVDTGFLPGMYSSTEYVVASYNGQHVGEKIPIKVVIENALLKRARDDFNWQRVSTVYLRSEEFRVMAPPKADGDALDWLDHLIVRHIGSQGYTDVTKDLFGILALRETEAELQNLRRDADRTAGMNPDGMYHDAFICHAAHVLSSFGDAPKSRYCNKCGEPVIADCLHCRAPIRGQLVTAPGHYIPPNFCHDCGRPYPWMENRLKTARALLDYDDNLTLDDRTELWDSLKYVMSDPKADLAPAKRRLIDIGLGKAAKMTRDAVMEFVVKYAAEMSKG